MAQRFSSVVLLCAVRSREITRLLRLAVPASSLEPTTLKRRMLGVECACLAAIKRSRCIRERFRSKRNGRTSLSAGVRPQRSGGSLGAIRKRPLPDDLQDDEQVVLVADTDDRCIPRVEPVLDALQKSGFGFLTGAKPPTEVTVGDEVIPESCNRIKDPVDRCIFLGHGWPPFKWGPPVSLLSQMSSIVNEEVDVPQSLQHDFACMFDDGVSADRLDGPEVVAAVARASGLPDELAARAGRSVLIEMLTSNDPVDSRGRHPYAAALHLLGLIDYPQHRSQFIPFTRERTWAGLNDEYPNEFPRVPPKFPLPKKQKQKLAVLGGDYGGVQRSHYVLSPGKKTRNEIIDFVAERFLAQVETPAARRVYEGHWPRDPIAQSAEESGGGGGSAGDIEPSSSKAKRGHRGRSAGRWWGKPAVPIVAAVVCAAVILGIGTAASLIESMWTEHDDSDERPGVAVAGWGPERDLASVEAKSSAVSLNSTIDHPDFGDTRNFVQVQEQGAWDTSAEELSVRAGGVYEITAFVHNDAAEDDANAASGVRMSLQLPAVVSGSGAAYALMSSENTRPQTVWDGAVVVAPTSTDELALRYVDGSAVFETTDGGRVELGDELFSSEGAVLNCGHGDGEIRASEGCSGFVRAAFRVDQPDFEVTALAKVKGEDAPYQPSVDTRPGTVLTVRLDYQNTGSTQQNDVGLRVPRLPEGLQYVRGSSRIANSTTGGEWEDTMDGIVGDGANVGSYQPEGSVYYSFDVIVTEDVNLGETSRWLTFDRFALAETNNGTKSTALSFTLLGARSVGNSGNDPAGDDYWEAHWGPDRRLSTVEEGGLPYPEFNSISDGVIGNEVNFVSLKLASDQRSESWTDDLWVDPGDRVLMRIYVNNAGKDSHEVTEAGWLQDARLQVGQSSTTRQTSVYGILTAANSKDVWDGATIHSEANLAAKWVPDSLKIESNYHPGPKGKRLSLEAAEGGGVRLGTEDMDGLIPPGYDYAAYISVELRMVPAERAAE